MILCMITKQNISLKQEDEKCLTVMNRLQKSEHDPSTVRIGDIVVYKTDTLMQSRNQCLFLLTCN